MTFGAAELVALALAASGPLAAPFALAGRAAIRAVGARALTRERRRLDGPVRLGLAAALIAAPLFAHGNPMLAAVIGVGGLLALFDQRWRWLPHEWTAALAFAGLLEAAVLGRFADHAAACVLIGGGLWALRAAYWRLRGAEGLGGGDVALGAGLGALLGTAAAPTALFAACAAALVVETVRTLVAPSRAAGERPRRIPFGVYLVGAILAGVALR